MSESQVVNQAYRVSVFSNIDASGHIRSGTIGAGKTVTCEQDANGLGRVQLRLPDNTIEYWQQTDTTYNKDSGFRAMAFVRCDSKGNTLLQNGEPQTLMTFPGNTNTSVDWDTSKRIVDNQNMDARYKEIEVFTKSVADKMKARGEHDGHGVGHITVGTYSMGAMGIGAGLVLKDSMPGAKIETVVLEPFGAGKAVEEWAVYWAAKTRIRNSEPFASMSDEDIRALSPQKMDAITKTIAPSSTEEMKLLITANAKTLTENTVSIRSAKSTVISDLAIGDEASDNAMIGKAYKFRTNDASLRAKFGGNHLAETVANSMLTYRQNALSATGEGLQGDKILETNGTLSNFEKLWAKIKTALFNIAASLGFTSVVHEPVGAQREGFEDMEDLPKLEEQRDYEQADGPATLAAELPGLHAR